MSAGTLIAVFAATSDEAVLILMANPGRAGEIIWLLAVKVVIAVAAGYFVDGVMQKYIVRTEKTCISSRGKQCGLPKWKWSEKRLVTPSVSSLIYLSLI